MKIDVTNSLGHMLVSSKRIEFLLEELLRLKCQEGQEIQAAEDHLNAILDRVDAMTLKSIEKLVPPVGEEQP